MEDQPSKQKYRSQFATKSDQSCIPPWGTH